MLTLLRTYNGRAIGFRIIGTFRGRRVALCGNSGRYWFAALPALCDVQMQTRFGADCVVSDLLAQPAEICVIVPIEESADGWIKTHPRELSLFVEG